MGLIFSNKPKVWELEYRCELAKTGRPERRTIQLQAKDEEEAKVLADRRLREQFGNTQGTYELHALRRL